MKPRLPLRTLAFLVTSMAYGALFGQGGSTFSYRCPAPVVIEQKLVLTDLKSIDEKASASFSGDEIKIGSSTTIDVARLTSMLERCGLAQCVRQQRIGETPREFVGTVQQGTIPAGSDERAVTIIQR